MSDSDDKSEKRRRKTLSVPPGVKARSKPTVSVVYPKEVRQIVVETRRAKPMDFSKPATKAGTSFAKPSVETFEKAMEELQQTVDKLDALAEKTKAGLTTQSEDYVALRKDSHLTPEEEGSADSEPEEAPIVESAQVYTPPGSKLLSISRKLFPPKFVSDILENEIIDMQYEYIDALDKGHKWHRRWICIRGYASFGIATVCGLSATVGKKLVDAWKAVNLS